MGVRAIVGLAVAACVGASGCRTPPWERTPPDLAVELPPPPDLYLPPPPDLLVHDLVERDLVPLDWEQQPSPTAKGLFGIWGSSALDVYAVGEGGTVLHTSDGGKLWQKQDTPVPRDLYAVWGSGAGDVYAVGVSGGVLHSRGDGTWSAQSTPTSEDLTGLWGSGAGDIYAIGTTATILHSTGDGSWHPQAAPGIGYDLWGVSGSGPTDVWAVGVVYGRHSVVLRSDGSSWRGVDIGSDAGAGLFPLPLLSAWTNGQQVLLVPPIMHSGDRGGLFALEKSLPTLESVWGTGDEAFAVGDFALIVHRRPVDGGIDWVQETAYAPDLDCVWGASPTEVWAVGQSGTILKRR